VGGFPTGLNTVEGGQGADLKKEKGKSTKKRRKRRDAQGKKKGWQIKLKGENNKDQSRHMSS